MDTDLATPAWLVGRLGFWGGNDPGQLSLSDGVLAFTSAEHGLVFRAPVQAARIRFPKLYFGLGFKVTFDTKTHRLCLLPIRSLRGETDMEGNSIVAGTAFYVADVRPAREIGRQWRAAVSQPSRVS